MTPDPHTHYPSIHTPHHITPLRQTYPPIGAVIAFAGDCWEPTTGDPWVPAPQNPAAIQPPYTTNTLTEGWALCDGRTWKQKDAQQLYQVIGTRYNTGHEQTGEFSLPDYRGYFLRMIDLNAQRDPDVATRTLPNSTQSQLAGSIQTDALQTHQHVVNAPGQSAPASGGGNPAVAAEKNALCGPPTSQLNPPGDVRTSTETRPINIYVAYLIRFA